MLDNAPVTTITHRDLTVEGYSRAAVQTYFRIPEMKLGFDLGGQPWDFMGTPRWFISHTHLDHIAALPVYVARRRMMKMEPPTIYVPAEAVELIERMLRVVSRLDRGRLPCELVPVRPGDEFEISRELVVTASSTRHTIPSIGYIVWERRQKLKHEYRDLSGDQIRDLRLSGVEITQQLRMPLVAYLGDSAPQGLDACPEMYKATILIAEMTFVAPRHRKEKIHKHGHMHLDDFLERRQQFENECIVVGHFSTRYHDNQIRSLIQQALPDMLDGRLQLCL